MRDLLRQFGSVPLALAAYNAGPAPCRACGCIPPYPETQAYVARILGLLSGAGDTAGLAPASTSGSSDDAVRRDRPARGRAAGSRTAGVPEHLRNVRWLHRDGDRNGQALGMGADREAGQRRPAQWGTESASASGSWSLPQICCRRTT